MFSKLWLGFRRHTSLLQEQTCNSVLVTTGEAWTSPEIRALGIPHPTLKSQETMKPGTEVVQEKQKHHCGIKGLCGVSVFLTERLLVTVGSVSTTGKTDRRSVFGEHSP